MSKVVSATLHAPLHHPGIGNIGPKLSAILDGVNKAVKMELSEDGKTLKVTPEHKVQVTISIPIANVFYYVEA